MEDAGNAPQVGLCPNGINNVRLIRASIVRIKGKYSALFTQNFHGLLYTKQLPVMSVTLGYLESFDVDQMHTHVCRSQIES